MAKHQQRVIVDVRAIFPPEAEDSRSLSVDESSDDYQPPYGRSSPPCTAGSEGRAGADCNTNPNFIFGGRIGFGTGNVGWCSALSGGKQNSRELSDAFPCNERDFMTTSYSSIADSNTSLLDIHSFDVNAFMTSYASGELGKRNPLFHGDSGECPDTQIKRSHDNSHNCADLSTSRNTNVNCLHQVDVKAGLGRVKSPNEVNFDSSVMAKNKYNEMVHNGELMEEEATMEFWEEEAEARAPQLFTEYQGDDYSQYLNDDVAQNEYPTSKRKDKRAKRPHATNILEMSTSNLIHTDLKSSPESKRTITQSSKFSRVFQFNSLNGKTKPIVNGQKSIHNFSYENSKIGINRSTEDTTGLSLPSDYGEVGDEHSKDKMSVDTSPSSWYSIERHAHGNSDVILRTRQPSMSSNGSSQTGSQEDFVARDENQIQPDFESTRKSVLYETNEKQSKKQKFFNKLKRHKKNSDKLETGVTDVVQNTVFNPLSDPSDVYL